jgi:hypothetical protein
VGAFDSGNDGFGSATVPVALYGLNGTTWSQVAGTSASFSGNADTLVGSARFQDLASPVTLNPGTYAIVAANYGVTGTTLWNAGLASPGDPRITFQNSSSAVAMASPNTAFYSIGVTTLGGTLSDLSYGSFGSQPILAGATFDFTPVPEAATYGAAAVGLLGLVYIGRYARLRRKLKPA